MLFSPPPRPASYSGCPTCITAPKLFETPAPEFIDMTGIPAATAALIGPPKMSGAGIDTTIPSGFCAIAASIKDAISFKSPVGGFLY